MTTKAASKQLTAKFINGLMNYNLTQDNIKDWRYCGGNQKNHLNYFKLCCKGEDLPNRVNECVCGHYIKENCYITNGDEILILGNCCIKKFIKKCTRTCEDCGIQHKRRNVNKCKECEECQIYVSYEDCDFI